MIELPARRGKDDAASLLESADAAANDEPRAPSPWARLASRLATPLLPDAGGPRGRLAKFLGLSYALLLGAFYFVRAHGDDAAREPVWKSNSHRGVRNVISTGGSGTPI